MSSPPRVACDAYSRRPSCYRGIEPEIWRDWHWQQRNAIRNREDLSRVFARIDERMLALADAWKARGLRFQITPYQQALVECDDDGSPNDDDPIWRQCFPSFPEILTQQGSSSRDEYSPKNENWECSDEMLTQIAQHKYDNRIIVYAADICLSYCGYCLRSMQSTAGEELHGGVRAHWNETLEVLRARPQIEELILSGGDPLVYENEEIDRLLSDVRDLRSIRSVRIHTRALSHNPYRADEGFCELLRKHGVTVLALHVVHPRELTAEFEAGIERIRRSGAITMLLAQTPLIRGINDDAGTLRELFMGLFTLGVKPYYLFHGMPNIPAASSQRTSVRRGAEIMRELDRKISNVAIPEFVIAHRTGKCRVPRELDGTSEFRYETDADGHPVVRFLSWRGTWETYLDASSH